MNTARPTLTLSADPQDAPTGWGSPRLTCVCGLLTHRTGFQRRCDGCDQPSVSCRCPRIVTQAPTWLQRKAEGQLRVKELVA